MLSNSEHPDRYWHTLEWAKQNNENVSIALHVLKVDNQIPILPMEMQTEF